MWPVCRNIQNLGSVDTPPIHTRSNRLLSKFTSNTFHQRSFQIIFIDEINIQYHTIIRLHKTEYAKNAYYCVRRWKMKSRYSIKICFEHRTFRCLKKKFKVTITVAERSHQWLMLIARALTGNTNAFCSVESTTMTVHFWSRMKSRSWFFDTIFWATLMTRLQYGWSPRNT